MKSFADKEKVAKPSWESKSPAQSPNYYGGYLHYEQVSPGIRQILRKPDNSSGYTISQPDDPYEQEADRVAEQVMRMPDPEENEKETFQAKLKDDNRIQRQIESPEDDEEEVIQAKSVENTSTIITPNWAANLRSLKAQGRPLSKETRAFFEPRFRADFSQVRVHTDTRANEMARMVNAKAFTHRYNIFFKTGHYQPENNVGRNLLAHELTHVVQQQTTQVGHSLFMQLKAENVSMDLTNGVLKKDSPGIVTDVSNSKFTLVINEPPAGKYYYFRWSARDAKNTAYRMRSVNDNSEVQSYSRSKHVFINTPSLKKIFENGENLDCEVVCRILETDSPEIPEDDYPGRTWRLSLEFDFIPKNLDFDQKAKSEELAYHSKEREKIEKQLSETKPQTPKERAALKVKLEQMVRLNAIKLMFDHRATILEARNTLISGENTKKTRDLPVISLDQLRIAAIALGFLEKTNQKLKRYQLNLYKATSLQGNLNTIYNQIYNNSQEFLPEEIPKNLKENQKDLLNDRYMAWAVAKGLLEQRTEQIFGVEQSITQIYQSFPVFAELKYIEIDGSNRQLIRTIDGAYKKIITKVDKIIRMISSNDVHPFDLPRAVQVTREKLSHPVQLALEEAITARKTKKFWITLGLTLLEAFAIALIPLGGAIALAAEITQIGIAVGLGATQLKDLLDRLVLVEAKISPYENVLKVEKPSPLEKTFLAIQGILTVYSGARIYNKVAREIEGILISPKGRAEFRELEGILRSSKGEFPILKWILYNLRRPKELIRIRRLQKITNTAVKTFRRDEEIWRLQKAKETAIQALKLARANGKSSKEISRLQKIIDEATKTLRYANSGRKKTPVVATAYEPASGYTPPFGNEPLKQKLHYVLKEEFEKINYEPYYGKKGEVHAETNAVNEALYARERVLQRKQTREDLKEILVDIVNIQNVGVKGMSRCTRCWFTTVGVKLTPRTQLAEFLKQMELLSGKRNLDIPF